MIIPEIDIEEKIKEIEKPWTPVDIAAVDDYVVRIALFDGEYHWHKHEHEDELFYVYRGRILIQIKDRPGVTVHEGRMAVVPKGVEHCPKSLEPSYVIMFEPQALKSKGD